MTITRPEVLNRAQTVWPNGSVPYSQAAIHRPDGYRQDCSGYLSMSWGIPLDAPGSWGGMNTVSLVTDGWMYEINPNELKPGDAIGMCGPGTSGDSGHVQLFIGWLNHDPNDSHYYCLEQAGGGWGPRKKLHDWPSGYKAYRFKGIVDDSVSPAPAPTPPPAPSPAPSPAPGPGYGFPLPQGYYFGPKEGPTESISGLYGERYSGRTAREWLQEWANQLSRRGWSVGKGRQWLGQYGNDGYYGSEYDALARAFQSNQHLTVDGLIGSQTWWASYHNPVN